MSKLFQRNEPNVTENRHKYVGGSDVPVILGLSKFKTQFELASEKIGITKSDFKGNEYTAFGHAIEPQIREYINLTTDYTFIENSVVDKKLGLRSNTDGVDFENSVLLEIKSHGAVPTMEVYKVQMQLYMFQNGLEEGLLALYERPKDFNLEFDADRLDTSVIVKADYDEMTNILHQIDLFWLRCEWLEENKGASEWDYNNFLKSEVIPGGKRKMSEELEVKTLDFKPAVIEFNLEEIEKTLETKLSKFKGLTFSEKESKELNKTVADLRKGKRLVEHYRIKTKKQLNEPVVAFEKDCKVLTDKFDEAIKPLLIQVDEFDVKQREEKLEKVKLIKDTVVDDLQLVEELAAQLILEERFTNKSTTLKSIEEELHEQANQLINNKLHEDQSKELIKTHVEMANLKNGLDMNEEPYLLLIETHSQEAIKEAIYMHAKDILETKKEKEVLEKQEAADEEKEKRLEGAAKMEASYKKEVAEKAVQEPEEEFLEIYEVQATEDQLDQLEDYLDYHDITYKVLEEDV